MWISSSTRVVPESFVGKTNGGDVTHPELVQGQAAHLTHADRAEFTVRTGH